MEEIFAAPLPSPQYIFIPTSNAFKYCNHTKVEGKICLIYIFVLKNYILKMYLYA